MKLVKARFEKTEFGGQMVETVKAIDFYLEEKSHTSQWQEPEKYKRLSKDIDRLFAQFEIFKLAVKQFYGVEYHFTRTDDYFGCCTNEGEDFLFRFEREKKSGKGLLKKLEKFEELEAAANKADEVYQAEPENAELEAAFDKAYKEEFEAMEELLNSITAYMNGEIDTETSKKMLFTHREELKQILEKAMD
ncbi:hypothetical protein IMSAGC002_03911 [Lachnospiraceae bacterium]|nr:hypothetical protein IMSAGC002_03911 [Lachnospiraceae bacterium]